MAEKIKMARWKIKKPLKRKGPNSSSIPELIVFYQNPKMKFVDLKMAKIQG
jgi:hypothetical protein